MDKIIKIEMKLLPLKSLVETQNNPQHMDKQTFNGLVLSMKSKGWLLDPATVWERPDGEYQIISGHHRSKAAIEAGILESYCKVIKGITEDQAKILVLEANQRRGKFDDDMLNAFIDEVVESMQIEKEILFEEIGLYSDIEEGDDIDFDNIKSTEDREKVFKSQIVTCPNCEESFEIKL